MFRHVSRSAGVKHAFRSAPLHSDHRCPLGDVGSLLKTFRAERSLHGQNGLITKARRRCLSGQPIGVASSEHDGATSNKPDTISGEHIEITTGDAVTGNVDELETHQDPAPETLDHLYADQVKKQICVEDGNRVDQNGQQPEEPWLTEHDNYDENRRSAIERPRAFQTKKNSSILKFAVIRRTRSPESEQTSTVPQLEEIAEIEKAEFDRARRLQRAKRTSLFEPLFQSFRKLIEANAGTGPPSPSDPSVAKLAEIRAEAMMHWVNSNHSYTWPTFLEANRLFLWYFAADSRAGRTTHLPGAIDLVVENYQLVLQALEKHPVSHRTAHKIITRSCNNVLARVFFKVEGRNFSGLESAYHYQSKLVDAMASMTPQIPLLRRGYRALIALQLAYPPNAHEWNWRSLQAKSWPPWRIERSGVDQNIEQNIVRSRAQKLLRQMQQDGYSWKTWEKRASILSGWDLDDSPTIAVEIYTGTAVHRELEVDQLDDSRNPIIWGAKIRATRNIIEAWSMYLSAEDHGVQDAQLASAIIERLIAEERRKLRRMNALDLTESEEFDRLSKKLHEGFFNLDIEPPSTDPRHHPRIRRNVPELSKFLDEIRPHGYSLSFHAMGLLLLHARDWVEFGSYLRDFARPNKATINLLINPLAITKDDFSFLGPGVLFIFVKRLIDRGPPTAEDCQTLGISHKAWTDSSSSVIRAICHFTNIGVSDESFVGSALVKELKKSSLPDIRMTLEETESFNQFVETRNLFLKSRDQLYHLIEMADDLLSQPSFYYLQVITQIFHQTWLPVEMIVQKQSEHNDPAGESYLRLLHQKDEFILSEIEKVLTKVTGVSLNTTGQPENFRALPSESFWYAYLALLQLLDRSKIPNLKIFLDVHKHNWLANPGRRDIYSKLVASILEAEVGMRATAKERQIETSEQNEEEKGFW